MEIAMKHYLVSILFLLCAVGGYGRQDIKVIISEGLSDQKVKERIEINISNLLTEVNQACAQERPLMLDAVDILPSGKKSLQYLWRNLHFYCEDNEIKLIHSSPYHPQAKGAVEVTHKEIQKYIFNEYLRDSSDFNIEDALFNIIEIHNNKICSTRKRISKEIKDIEDENENNKIKSKLLEL